MIGKVVYATTFWQRARGMLFGRGAGAGECLVIAPCSDIHTFGMRFCIDVAFVDERGKVLDVQRGLKPLCTMRCKGAYAVIERKASVLPWFKMGTRVSWAARNAMPKRRFALKQE